MEIGASSIIVGVIVQVAIISIPLLLIYLAWRLVRAVERRSAGDPSVFLCLDAIDARLARIEREYRDGSRDSLSPDA